jgi:hypothetical protein
MHLHALDYVLWVATPSLQGCVIYFLRKRGLASEFPLFYAYNILQFTTDIFLLCVERISYTVYFYAYWVVTATTVALTFALIDELFRLAFRNYGALKSVGSQIFRWILLLAFLAAFGMALTLPSVRGTVSYADFILMADRCARIMLCLWALLLVIGSSFMRIAPRSMLFGIALGVVIFAFSKIVVDSFVLSHASSSHLGSRINSCMHLMAAVCRVWRRVADIPTTAWRAELRSARHAGERGQPQPHGCDQRDGRAVSAQSLLKHSPRPNLYNRCFPSKALCRGVRNSCGT